jgi:hypothetical protein
MTRARRQLSWRRIGATATILALAEAASALPLTLNQEAQGAVGPQSTSNPCVIAATQCSQPAGFDFTNFTQSGADPDYDEVSPTYTAGQLAGFGFTSFNVAIDVNTTNAAAETLQLFEVIVGGVPLYTFTGPSVIGGVSNNGNGFADWTLRTVDLSGVASGASVVFHAVWDNASDGGESFFLISTAPPAQVPEPGTAALLGLVLAGLGLVRFLRRRDGRG